jgi:hypothetical protein
MVDKGDRQVRFYQTPVDSAAATLVILLETATNFWM